MTREEFKKEFLTDAFFFVNNRRQFETLQEVGLEFGLVNPIGDHDLIAYDRFDIPGNYVSKPGVDVAKNLTFFPDGKFQKSECWFSGASYGKPKNYVLFMQEYACLM